VEAIRDRRVLAAFRKVPRARFVPAAATGQAYLDAPIRKEAGQLLADAWLTPAYFVPLVGIHGIRSREDRNER
jgi:protein-L-isoaspartate O-methyltransferase